MTNSDRPVSETRRYLPSGLAWLILILVSLAAFAMVFVPAFIIMPFKAQTRDGLALSYTLRSWSPVVTVIALLIVLLMAVLLWRRRRRWWRKPVMILALLISILSAWLARQNHFEWMFNPLANPGYTRAAETDFVETRDMVLAVESNGEAAAYPIRQLAYHHVVQDVVGGTPIVATY
jgi:uncharacterized protein DUF3179